jgi:hypothetical protein
MGVRSKLSNFIITMIRIKLIYIKNICRFWRLTSFTNQGLIYHEKNNVDVSNISKLSLFNL